jgi:hypothetical protein
MSLARGKLADIQYVASSAGSLYANPGSTKSYIRGFTLFNGNTTTENVKLYNVPDSSGSLGTAGVSNQFTEIALLAKETLFIDLPHPIVLTDTNDSIQGVTTTASKVTFQIHGDKDP